jgi:hypothetical protein
MIAWAISGPGGRGSILFTTAQEIRPETWYRRNITYLLYRYTFVPNLCISFAPVHVSTIFTTANRKSPSKTVVHKTQYKRKIILERTSSKGFVYICLKALSMAKCLGPNHDWDDFTT